MGMFPWGPHGPQSSPLEVRPNPTAASPAPAFEQPEYQGPVGTPGGFGGTALPNIIFSLVLLACVWEAFVCLYPLTSAAGILAGFFAASALTRMFPPDLADAAFVLGFVVGAVVVGIVIRIEYRLAQNLGFRLGRHVLRLLLLGIWAIPIIMLSMGVTAPSTTTRFILAIVSSPATMWRFLSVPMNLGIWFAVMVGLHFIIWNWGWARRVWHGRLKWVGLK
jgi:hypothetical protein